jgi:hypothetical protein
MKKLFFLITISILVSSSLIFAQEQISKIDDSALPILNDELRKLDIDEQIKTDGKLDLHDTKIENVATPTATTDATTKAYVDALDAAQTAKFNTSTGHDHDGSDSKTIPGIAKMKTTAYTGTNSALTVAHGLGTTPTFMMILCLSDQSAYTFTWGTGMTANKMRNEQTGDITTVFASAPDATNVYFASGLGGSDPMKTGISYLLIAFAG